MAELGIQSLILALAVSMIFATSLILGGISISTGNTATDAARETGDRGISQCMKSSSVNVKEVTARLLLSILIDLKTKMLGILGVPTMLSQGVASFLKLYHPDEVSNPVFIDTVLRNVLFSKYKQSVELYGPHSLGFVALNTTPNGKTFREAFGGAWGGEILYSVTGNYENGSYIYYTAESRQTFPNGYINYQPMYYHGEVFIDTGRLIPKPCHLNGKCFANYLLLRKANAHQLVNPCFYNMQSSNPKTALYEPGPTYYSELVSGGTHVEVQVCTSVVHPEQQNFFPKQDKRVGMITSSTSTSSISNVMKEVSLPSDSILYAVERNPFTKVVNIVAGCNVGMPYYVFRRRLKDGRNIVRAAPFPIVDHTTDGEIAGEISPIARHGRYMFEMSEDGTGGAYYDYADNLAPEIVLNWTDTSTSILYWVRVTSVKISNVHWYIVLLVPRESVMSVMDTAADMININIEKDKKDTDDKRAHNYMIMYVVTAGCVVILLALSVVFTNIIISPLIVLRDDMAAVAVMATDDVNLTVPLSSLSEVKEMQNSFRQMVRNLIEYKNYMPQSVLLQSEDSDTNHQSSEDTTVSSLSRSTPQQVAHQQAMEMRLKKKCVTIIMFNSIGWHNRKECPTATIELHCSLIECLTAAVSSNRGVCDAFTGDRLMAYFNANRNNNGHQGSAVKAGLMAKAASKLQLSFGVASGDSKVGNIGIVGMKKFSILSAVVPLASSLEKLCTAEGYDGLIDNACAEHSNMVADSRAAVLVLFRKLFERSQLVFEAKALRKISEEEWMYQLEAESKFAKWNEFVHKIVSRNFNKANELLNKLDAFTGDNVYSHWRQACKQRVFEAVDLSN